MRTTLDEGAILRTVVQLGGFAPAAKQRAGEKKATAAKSPADLAAQSPSFGAAQYATAAAGLRAILPHKDMSQLRDTIHAN